MYFPKPYLKIAFICTSRVVCTSQIHRITMEVLLITGCQISSKLVYSDEEFTPNSEIGGYDISICN
jgi:hypothetical protein